MQALRWLYRASTWRGEEFTCHQQENPRFLGLRQGHGALAGNFAMSKRFLGDKQKLVAVEYGSARRKQSVASVG